MLEAATGLKVSFKSVDRAFARLSITHQKTLVARERSEERRAAFLNELSPYLEHLQRLVFLDESGFNTSMTRRYARAPSHLLGQNSADDHAWPLRAIGQVARNHGLNSTLICAVSLARPLAPLVIEGAMNGATFAWYVREFLCPMLGAGQVVVLDNLSSHHQASIRTPIEARGCSVLYLLPYSPDFNPTLMLFSKLKAYVRASSRDSVQSLFDSIDLAL